MQLNNFRSYSGFKSEYLTLDRDPFFALAAKYIGSSRAVMLDIGSGEGDFFVFLKNKQIDTSDLYLLDGNESTVEKNKALTSHSVCYLIPGVLPFKDASVDFVHISHLVDNLNAIELYQFLKEVDRVLKTDGIMVISTPMLWPNFYDDISHTRPYNPYVFYKYLVDQKRNSRFEGINSKYALENLTYRYYELPLDEGWSSTLPFIDILIISLRRLLRKISFKRLGKNGYTLILRKKNAQPL